MARTDERYRVTFNKLLTICDSLNVGDPLPTELALADDMAVSRTVIRNTLKSLHDKKIIQWKGRVKTVIRKPTSSDLLTIKDEFISIEELETKFLDWILRFDVPPQTVLNVAKLSKQFSVAPHTLQEFLSGLSQFGLVERRPRGGWILNGFSADFALELSEFRTILELNAVKHIVKLPPEHGIWAKLDDLEARHLSLLERIDTDYHDFSELDEAFHTTVNRVVTNRFVVEFQKVISLIFHYHFQWDKSDEAHRNKNAIKEHLLWIEALKSGDESAAEKAALNHLQTSKDTLLSSLKVHNLV
ncbi:MAG: GntR family transcriptional regulator [Paracoccaceae bacterium]